ncbi:Protein phosphatase methylesterase 1 [Coemansia sp. Benny D115]|nr:Protein phosphatase methylesterase 1 [Coemansia sp. Benny D115]
MDLRQSMFKARTTAPTSLTDSGDPASSSGEYQPLSWSDYFEDKKTVSAPDSTLFNVYASGLANTTGPLFVLHHGAGHSGLTFGLAAKHIMQLEPQATVIAPDARGHGLTTGPDEETLSLKQLVSDCTLITKAFLGDKQRDTALVGHSMGGAVVAHVAASRQIPRVTGLVLIDIVEGSAMDSLHAIPGFIAARPHTFKSVSSAIKWHVDSDAIQNLQSARLSVPSLITQQSDNDLWTWRTQLLPTEKFWRGWYLGLSKTFIGAPTAKLLVLAGTDRLDKELLIAQMQGRFQLDLLPAAGHTIQEDLPDRIAGIIVSFWKRNQPLNIPVRRLH